MAYSLILVAAILKSNMAAGKRKSQPGKLPIMILEILRNILIPLASFYPECLVDLIFRHKFGFCPLTTIKQLKLKAMCALSSRVNTSQIMHAIFLNVRQLERFQTAKVTFKDANAWFSVSPGSAEGISSVSWDN